MFIRSHEEFRIEVQRTVRRSICFDKPSADPFRIELLVPCGVQRISKIYPFAISTDLYHLWAAIQRTIWITRVRCSADHSADLQHRGQLRTIGYRGVVAPQLSRSPARNVQPFVV